MMFDSRALTAIIGALDFLDVYLQAGESFLIGKDVGRLLAEGGKKKE